MITLTFMLVCVLPVIAFVIGYLIGSNERLSVVRWQPGNKHSLTYVRRSYDT